MIGSCKKIKSSTISFVIQNVFFCFRSKIQNSFDKTKPLIKVNQKQINIEDSYKVVIGNKDQISEKFEDDNCKTISPRYLPQTIDCGLDNFFCSAQSHKKVVLCYWNTYSQTFTETNIEPALCSHLIYSNVAIDQENNSIGSKPEWITNKGYRCYLRYIFRELKVTPNLQKKCNLVAKKGC